MWFSHTLREFLSFTYSGGYSTKTFEVEEIPTAPAIATPTIISSNTVRWNFTDNADNETGFRLYDDSGNLKASTSSNATYIDETGVPTGVRYTRYIKAYNSYGESSASGQASAVITGPSQQGSVSIPSGPTTQTTTTSATSTQNNTSTTTIQQTSTSTQATTSVSFEKPISQMTQNEIIAKIAQITQAISQLQSLLAQTQLSAYSATTIPTSFQFLKNMGLGAILTDVKYLQMLLNQNPDTQVALTGFGSPGQETIYFGEKTKQAVIKFQEKFKDTILTPLGLLKGTGIVAKNTRDKLNELLGK